jgi:hypothetical protein
MQDKSVSSWRCRAPRKCRSPKDAGHYPLPYWRCKALSSAGHHDNHCSLSKTKYSLSLYFVSYDDIQTLTLIYPLLECSSLCNWDSLHFAHIFSVMIKTRQHYAGPCPSDVIKAHLTYHNRI